MRKIVRESVGEVRERVRDSEGESEESKGEWER